MSDIEYYRMMQNMAAQQAIQNSYNSGIGQLLGVATTAFAPMPVPIAAQQMQSEPDKTLLLLEEEDG